MMLDFAYTVELCCNHSCIKHAIICHNTWPTFLFQTL